MASVYTVKKSQNIYDVAVQIYGSIEGLFDLLISNENLAVDSELKEGQELLFHPMFIQNSQILNKLNSDKIILANGTIKETPVINLDNVQFIIEVQANEGVTETMKISGYGPIVIDWGDSVEVGELPKDIEVAFAHPYRHTCILKLFVSSDNPIVSLDVRGISGRIYLQECFNYLASYAENQDNIEEGCIGLIGKQLKKLTLINKLDFDAMVLERFDLSYLNLTGATFRNESITNYILSRQEKGSSLGGGEIYLSESSLSTQAIEAIYDLVNDERNGDKWTVFVDDTVFKKDGFDYFMNFPLS